MNWQERALAAEQQAEELNQKLNKLTALIRQNQESGLLVSLFAVCCNETKSSNSIIKSFTLILCTF